MVHIGSQANCNWNHGHLKWISSSATNHLSPPLSPPKPATLSGRAPQKQPSSREFYQICGDPSAAGSAMGLVARSHDNYIHSYWLKLSFPPSLPSFQDPVLWRNCVLYNNNNTARTSRLAGLDHGSESWMSYAYAGFLT